MKILAHLLLIACTALPVAALAQVKSLMHKEEKRRYLVYTPPSYDQQQPQHQHQQKAYPVVFNFHGSGMTMAEQMLYTQMNRAADRHQFIVVYPSGVKQDWNVGFGMSYLDGPDDIGFTQALLAKIKQDYRVDAQRVYATGLSRGGFFALRIAAELPQLFAAVASVGAPMPEPVIAHHTSPGKIGVLQLHGTADQVVAYAGKPAAYLSAEATYSYWLQKNGIAASDASNASNAKSAMIGTDVVWQEQSNGQQRVALATIRDGGHTWPGADAFNIGLPLGKTTTTLDANQTIWQFFTHHQLTE